MGIVDGCHCCQRMGNDPFFVVGWDQYRDAGVVCERDRGFMLFPAVAEKQRSGDPHHAGDDRVCRKKNDCDPVWPAVLDRGEYVDQGHDAINSGRRDGSSWAKKHFSLLLLIMVMQPACLS